MGGHSVNSERDRHRVGIRRQIGVSAERAFDALTRADLLSRWFTTAAQVDLRVGGRYRNADHDEGEFLVIEPPRRLHFTWENTGHCPGTVVELELRPLSGDSVELSLPHRDIKDAAGALDMERGWSWAMDSLKSFLEVGKPVPHAEWEAAQDRSR